MINWQPIETAPKETVGRFGGKKVLGYDGDFILMSWGGENWADDEGRICRPTHWADLTPPAAPVTHTRTIRVGACGPEEKARIQVLAPACQARGLKLLVFDLSTEPEGLYGDAGDVICYTSDDLQAAVERFGSPLGDHADEEITRQADRAMERALARYE